MLTLHQLELHGLTATEFLEAAPVAIVVSDVDGRPEYVNREALELMPQGIGSAVPLEQSSSAYGLYVTGTDLLYPWDRRPTVVAAQTAADCWVDDIEIRRPDKTIQIEVRSRPMSAPDGRVACVVSYFGDVTDRRNSETERVLTDALAQAMIRAPSFGEAVQMSLDRICQVTGWTFGQAWLPDTTGSDLHCEYASYSDLPGLAEYHAACRGVPVSAGVGLPGQVWLTKQPEWLSDLTPDLHARVGKELLQSFPPGFRHRLAIPVLADGGVVAVFCFFVLSRSEHDQRLLDRVAAVVAQVGSWISSRRAGDLRAQQVQDALELEKLAVLRLNNLYTMKDTVLQTVTHDLRSPIAAVLTLTQALLDDAAGERVMPRQLRTKMLANVERGAQEMERLLHDLVDSEPMHELDSRRCRCDVGDIVARTLSRSDLAELHPVHTDIESVVISVNAAHVERIVHNLLTNASKHVAPGVALWVKTEKTESGVLIVVEDAGVGVPAEVAKEIFEPFRRGDCVTTQGLGLGLSLVARFAELHGGRAWVEERVGGGASFRVELPDSDDNEQAGSAFSSASLDI